MSNYAILRTKKLNSWSAISGSMNHTYRRNPTPNADPVRLGKNKVLVGNANNGELDIRTRLDQVTSKPRKNAVLAVECLLTASPEWFKDKTEKQISIWANRNIKFLQEKFGAKNVVHAVLHRDETTPHIAAFIVPERDGKLNCRSYLGGRDLMKNFQTDYAAAMSSMKLERGVEGSKATHKTVKSFYADINKVAASAQVQLEKISKPVPYPVPTVRAIFSKEVRKIEKINWSKQDRLQKIKLVKIAENAVLSAKIAKDDNTNLKFENSHLSHNYGVLKERLSTMYDVLELTKENIMHLRKLNLSAVAERLGYFDEISAKENAIDLVKRVNEFDYQQAVAWLHDEFGATAAVAAVKENLEAAPPVRPLTNSEMVIKKEIKAQLKALACDRYRISIISNDGSGVPYLPGKHGNQESFFTAEEIEQRIPYLRYENNVGNKHIYITPMDNDAHYVLIDDCKKSMAELEKEGFKPCLVQNTSWNSMQVVLKVPKDVDRRAVIDVFNKLNKDFGDPKMTGLKHPFRLAGFRNMKPKHERNGQFPFVNVIAAINRYCRKTMDLVAAQQVKLFEDKKPKIKEDLADQQPRIPRR